MAVPTSANYIFLPWVRQGASSVIPTRDGLGNNPKQPGVASLTVKLRVNGTDDVERQVRLYGPGDVVGFDRRQVVRTEPRHLSADFEPNYFPAIEFDRPEFPWLFTPARSGKNESLRPWLCLVVVRKQDGVALRTNTTQPLPVLDVGFPAVPDRELPDLSDSSAWAHVQVTGSGRDDASLKKALAGDPALTVSRLLCPRRLDPLTSYLACVVPTFKLGVMAGLGKPITEDDEVTLELAWKAGEQQVSLPVYYHWEFRTGTGDDFEELVRLLEPRKMPEEVGKRLLDISRPGFKTMPATPLELEGALRVSRAPAPWPDESRQAFQAELRKILNAPSLAATPVGTGPSEPLLAPPIYGEWYAARHTVNLPAAPPAVPQWLDELNLDPRHRGVAALGTQVVQTQQEQLMASAWEQFGQIQRVNQMLRQAQLARAVTGVYHAKHFARFSPETLLKVIAPAQSRVVIPDVVNNVATRSMLSRKIAGSSIPSKAVSAPMRRLTSARGVINTRFRKTPSPTGIVARMNAMSFVAALRKEAGLVIANTVSAQIPALAQTVTFARSAIASAPPHNNFRVFPEGVRTPPQPGVPGQKDSDEAKAFRDAVKAEQDYVQATFRTRMILFLPAVKLDDTRDKLLQSVSPEKTITARVQASLSIKGSALLRDDPLEPFMDAPVFPQPMYEALRDLSQDFLFPGLEHVPPNTVTLLETNPKFVESFMVGLNAEMGREMLWRHYPTDQRGTSFHQFWDTSSGTDKTDIESIIEWGPNELGKNARAGGNLVLLIRGELLRRYPNSVIYAVPATKIDGRLDFKPGAAELHPDFRGTLNPDVTFLGFDLKETDALADPGWFFVIQQQPTEPRFGMDAPDFGKDPPKLTTWNNLSWQHLAKDEGTLKALSHASAKTRLGKVDGAEWGRNSAHQAFITLQRPVRIFIHAKDMIPKNKIPKNKIDL